VLEVLPLSQDTSLLLLGFGLLLVVGLAVGGIVVHRRWRDAVS
jgi:predicted MFS family arabinose efflux permease